MLLNWALKPEGGDKGGFSQRVTDIRQRLLSVLELDEETAEVRCVDVPLVAMGVLWASPR